MPNGKRGQTLTVEQELEMGRRVLKLAARGLFNIEIAKALDLNRKTVARLKQKYVGEVFTDRDREELRSEVLQSIADVKRRAWEELDRTRTEKVRDVKTGKEVEVARRTIEPTSHNLPKLLDNIRQSDELAVKLLGLAEPEEFRHEVKTPLERTRAYEDHKARQRENFELIYGGKSGGKSEEDEEDAS